MATEKPTHTHRSTRTTGNEPLEGIDPGGARPTRPGQRDKAAPTTGAPATDQRVTSGDRNTARESRTPNPQPD